MLSNLEQHLGPTSCPKIFDQGHWPRSFPDIFDQHLWGKSWLQIFGWGLGPRSSLGKNLSPLSLTNLLEQDHATRPALAKPRSFITIFDQNPGSTSLTKIFDQHLLLDQDLGHLWSSSMICIFDQDHWSRCWTTPWTNTLDQDLWCLWTRSLISIFGQGHWPRPWTTPWTNILPQDLWPRSLAKVFPQHLWSTSLRKILVPNLWLRPWAKIIFGQEFFTNIFD